MRIRPWRYIEDETGTPIPVDDLVTWAEAFEAADRRVEETEIGAVRISTVFLGIDTSLEGPPMVYETMIFGGPRDGYRERFCTRSEALAGHAAVVRLVLGEH